MTEGPLLVTREAVLEVKGLRVDFRTYAGDVKALNGVELTVEKGEILGLVGESGCGKSVTALAIAGLLPENAEVRSGEVLLDEKDLLKQGKNEIRLARLTEIALIFQDPMTYLNPVLSIGTQLTEMFTGNLRFYGEELIRFRVEQIEKRLASGNGDSVEKRQELDRERERLAALRDGGSRLKKREANRLAILRSIEFLKMVRMPEPERIMKMYPFELSGGMR